MHAAISSLISTILLLHAVLGCCWHHAHDCAGKAVAVEGCACHHACPNHQSSGDEPAPATPCPAERDCPGVWTYLPTERTQFELPLLPTLLDALPTPSALADTSPPATPAWLDALFCTGAAPHVRLHLAQSVLLI
jgi:hypothetical protein